MASVRMRPKCTPRAAGARSQRFKRSTGTAQSEISEAFGSKEAGLLFSASDDSHLRIGRPCVLRYPEGEWTLFFTAAENDNSRSFFVCDSEDGVFWNRNTSDVALRTDGSAFSANSRVGRVLDTTSSSVEWFRFDSSGHISLGDVLPLGGDGSYLLFYSGGDQEEVDGSRGARRRVGIAVSSDGRLFGRAEGDEPTAASLDHGDESHFDRLGPDAPKATIAGKSELRLFFHATNVVGGTPRIGVALSSNGITFRRPNDSNPVLSEGPAGSIDEGGCSHPHVVRMDNGVPACLSCHVIPCCSQTNFLI
jgi:hypothetical protein